MIRRPPRSTLFPSTTLSRSLEAQEVYGRYETAAEVQGRFQSAVRARPGARGSFPANRWLGSFRVDRKSTRLNSSHGYISYAVFCLKKKKFIGPVGCSAIRSS